MSNLDEPGDDFAPPLVRRQVDLRPELLDRLWLGSSYHVLEETLLAAGFLLNLEELADEPGHPLCAVARVQRHLFALGRAQDAAKAIEVLKPLTRGEASPSISLFIALSTFTVVSLSAAYWATLGKAMGAWGTLALVGLVYSMWWFGKRRRLLRAAHSRVEELREALSQALRDTLLRNFVARHGDTLVTCRAHGDWAQTRFSDLERARHRTHSAFRDAEAGSEQREQLEATCERLDSLHSRLKDDIAEVARSFAALVAESPDAGQWLDTGLALDVIALREELQGLGVEFSQLDQRFERLLAESGSL